MLTRSWWSFMNSIHQNNTCHFPGSQCELTGTIARVVWRSDDRSLVIAKLDSGATVKGIAEGAGLELGTAYRFLGRWQVHPKHGQQFHFLTYIEDAPADKPGIIKYLVDECPGVGRRKAEALWDAFGSEVVTVVRTDPARVVQSGVLNAEQARKAAQALAAIADLERTKIDLFTLFVGRGFPGILIHRCIARWGARAAEVVRRNPFRLLVDGMPGCGFKRSDKLFIDLNGNPSRLKRQMLCLWHAIESETDGNTWHPARRLATLLRETIGEQSARPLDAARLGKRAGWLVSRKDEHNDVWLADATKVANEHTIAARVHQLMRHQPCPWPRDGFEGLSDHQAETIKRSLQSAVGILAGTPGTGKTYTAAAVIRRLAAEWGSGSIAIAAPTGKAAVRCTMALKHYGVQLQATTIHRLLKVQQGGPNGRSWNFEHHAGNPLPFRFLILDEASMLDTDLAAALLSACAEGTHILFVGDLGQLLPVNHGAPLRDLIAAGIPCGELTEIHRNAGLIVRACVAIRAGQRFEMAERYDAATGMNLRHVETSSAGASIQAVRSVLARFRDSGRFDPLWDCQVLVAVNGKSDLSRHRLNLLLQAELNPNGHRAEPNPFRVGDKIICLKNNTLIPVSLRKNGNAENVNDYEAGQSHEFIANGEIGRVVAVASQLTVARFPLPERTFKIPTAKRSDAEDDADCDASAGAGCDFALAYAITTHKMQGSEAPAVIALIDGSFGAMRVTSREWWYTALSRAQKLCVTIGRRVVLEQQCRRRILDRRKTFLKEMLTEGYQHANG
jgi:exodeoxyribonuclease V alpha subunit